MDTGKRNHMQRHLPNAESRLGKGPEHHLDEFFGIRRPMFYPQSCNSESRAILYTASPSSVGGSHSGGLAPAVTMGIIRSVGTESRDGVHVGNIQITRGVEMLPKCKHVDRKQGRQQCPGAMRVRNHKRGYLTVVCDLGHQWVWCSYCCDCGSAGIGCAAAQHWMERDSFDTGRRNHMQRHLENYDADCDRDGAILLAQIQPRQVAMAPPAGAPAPRPAGNGAAAGGPVNSYADSINEAPPNGRGGAGGCSESDSAAADRGAAEAGLTLVAASNRAASASPPPADGAATIGPARRGAPNRWAADANLPAQARAHKRPRPPDPASAGDPTSEAGSDRPEGGAAAAAAATEEDLGSIGVAASALIALRRSARIHGPADD